jgi:D-alanyl-D-alanine carboxypeptidase
MVLEFKFRNNRKEYLIKCTHILSSITFWTFTTISPMHTSETSQLLMDLGITSEIISDRKLLQYEEADSLVLAETGEDGREHLLISDAASAWRELRGAAEVDGEKIFVVSAFRTISRQAEIISNKIECGINIDEILLVCAPPGYSEHHTGRALDVSTPGIESLNEEFENTTAFKWLQSNADKFSFSLSYPRGNAAGYNYEPWHWCFNAT